MRTTTTHLGGRSHMSLDNFETARHGLSHSHLVVKWGNKNNTITSLFDRNRVEVGIQTTLRYRTVFTMETNGSTYESGQHVVVDGSGGVVELVLQGRGDHRPAQRLGGAQGDLLGVRSGGLGGNHRGGGGGAGGGGSGGRGGGRDDGGGRRRGGGGAGLRRGGGLALGVGRQTERQRGGLQVPPTTLPPARHIWEGGIKSKVSLGHVLLLFL